MSTLSFDFEEVALTLGKDAITGKQQRIGLITGSCEIEREYRSKEWEITEVTLSGPILHDPDVTLHAGHPLFNCIVDSIEQSCGDKIWDELLEAARPDPDHERDRRRDDAMWEAV
jgi:hypothetical protein